MKHTFKFLIAALAILTVAAGCKKTDYNLGDLSAPTNLVINTEVVGQDAAHPDGDGSGDVRITMSADGALSYKIDYDASDGLDPVYLATGTTTRKYTLDGVNTYRITVIAYGKGGTSSTTTKDVTVRSDFAPDPQIITDLTNDASKTWSVDKDVPGHMGVGPWGGSFTPEWWAASPNEKVACCNCFYTSTFVFTKVSTGVYSLQANTPDGAFTKTGSLTTLPGIPGSGDEGCYSYAGGTSSFSFVPSSSGSSNSTGVAIQLNGNDTFIGYGAVLKTYEILEITPTYLYLRVQGTETGNAWYLKLKSS